MSNKILPGDGAQTVAPVSWRKLDRREKPRPKNSGEGGADAAQSSPPAENPVEEAYKRGFSQGVTNSQADAQAQVSTLIERLSENIRTLSELRHRLRLSAEEDLVKLSIAVAQRILNRELSVDPSSIQGVIRVALEKLQSREISRVRIHPAHEAPVRSYLTGQGGGAGQIVIVPDSSLQLGDVIFETTQGEFDASLDFQLREIERGFTDRLNA